MVYFKAGRFNDLPKGQMSRVNIGKEKILIANVEGNIYAVSDRCGHMNGSLSMGRLDGIIIECPLHKARYDVTTGKCVRGPQMGGLEGIFVATTGMGRVVANIETLDLKTYRTKVERGVIRVEIPECKA